MNYFKALLKKEEYLIKFSFFSFAILLLSSLSYGHTYIDYRLIFEGIFYEFSIFIFSYLPKSLDFFNFFDKASAALTNEDLQKDLYIIFEIRLPRSLFAAFSGAGLSVSGLVLQSLYRNPLVSPNMMAVGPAAAFGSILAIFLNLSFVFRIILGFFFALLSIALLLLSIHNKKKDQEIYFLLTGVILSSFFYALIQGIKYFADPQQGLPEIINWLMGSFIFVQKEHLLICIPIIFIYVLLYKMRFQLNNLLIHEEDFSQFYSSFKIFLLLAISLIVTSINAISGNIAWVGLIIPNLMRMLVGANHNYLVPFTLIFGAHYLLLLDIFTRTMSLYEIPIGIFTSFFGAIIFFFLLLSRRSQF